MLCDDVVHLLHQIQPFEYQMRGYLLKITNTEENIFVTIPRGVITNMLHQPSRDITTAFRDRFTI